MKGIIAAIAFLLVLIINAIIVEIQIYKERKKGNEIEIKQKRQEE